MNSFHIVIRLKVHLFLIVIYNEHMRRDVFTKLVSFIKVEPLRARGEVVAVVSKLPEPKWATWNKQLSAHKVPLVTHTFIF